MSLVDNVFSYMDNCEVRQSPKGDGVNLLDSADRVYSYLFIKTTCFTHLIVLGRLQSVVICTIPSIDGVFLHVVR